MLFRSSIDVVVDVEPVDLHVMAEEAAIGSVIINLVRNAIDAMQDAPTRHMFIQARSENGMARMRVIDTGPGIRADILPRLFEPFVTSKPAGAGLGLGLVISAQVVRASGGKLRAINRPEGGACFTVELPTAAAQE